jgi:hypothetical protein
VQGRENYSSVHVGGKALVALTHLGVEGAQLDLLCVGDQTGVGVVPGHRHRGGPVGVNQQVEGTGLVQQGQEGHGGRDLAHDGLDLLGNLLQRFV